MVDTVDDPIELVSSRHGEWTERFDEERERVREALTANGLDRRLERIEHVGSTAVPTLAAKGIVDIDVVVTREAVGATSTALVEELGGTRVENHDGWHPVFREHGGQRFNDHVFAASDDGWRTSVVTRDVLGARPDLRREYERLKRDLAADHDDLVAYSEGKSEFIGRLLAVARGATGLTDCAVPPTR